MGVRSGFANSMSTLGNITAPSLSPLFTRKDCVQYTATHFDDPAYLLNRFGSRYGEILVPETWQGNFDGSDSTSDPVDWYSVDEMTMDYVVDRQEVTLAGTSPPNTKIYVFIYTLTYSSPGRTSIVQTGECSGTRAGGSYDSTNNRINWTDIFVHWPPTVTDWKLHPQMVQQGLSAISFGGSISLNTPIVPTITPDPPTENWLPKKGVWDLSVYVEIGGSFYGGAQFPTSGWQDVYLTSYAKPNRTTINTTAQTWSGPTLFNATSGNVYPTAKHLTTSPLWIPYFFSSRGINGALIGAISPDRALRYTVEMVRT